MKLLSPQDFYRQHQGFKTLSLVGSSDSVIKWENGARIESNDLVVRFNRATVKGFEKQVGSRTDLLVCNQLNTLKRSPSPVDLLHPKAALLMIGVDGMARLGQDDLSDWLGDIPTFSTLVPDIVEVENTTHERLYSTGTYALYFLTKAFSFEKIFITGFSFFGLTSGNSGHYFRKSELEIVWHNPVEDAKMFAAILSRFPGKVEMSPEVEEVMREVGYKGYYGGRSGPIPFRLNRWFANSLLRTAYRLRRYSKDWD